MQHDRRRAPRKHAEMFVNKFIDGWPHLARLVEISSAGCLLERVLEPDLVRDVYPLEFGLPAWSGGTRIGVCLREFSWKWGRRVLGQNACVVLVSDGLDREAGEGLSEEMQRLHKSCRELVWLNPLLRYDKFEARPAGVRAMLPHVDRFLPVHNLKSLIDLAHAISQPAHRHVEKRAWK